MHKITQQYQTEIEKYNSYYSKLELLIKELLTSNNVKYHKIEARAKSVESLEKKILSKDNKYNNIDDVTDIVGIRIITYFEDEVDIVANVIGNEFKIDKENSADKRILENNTFGYRSLHYVAQLNIDRGRLVEYKRFSNIKFEIQIRSILQHAWAEIEHDLGYKGLGTVPDSFKRNFSMIAALLEMADRDFVTLREESKGYKDNVASFIKEAPQNVDINIDSLRSFILKNEEIKNLDNLIIQNAECFLNKPTLYQLDMNIAILSFFNIKTIDVLCENLINNKKNIIDFAKDWLKDQFIGQALTNGISILYLGYVLIAAKEPEIIRHYLSETKLGSNIDQTIERIKDTYNKINQTK